jgi:hypothetical protein
MKTLSGLFCISPLVLLIAGCAAPVAQDHTIAEWQNEGLLPPTGAETTQVYEDRSSAYPATEPSIIVQTDQRRNASGDLALADAIRQQVEYDRGLAPSLRRVTIQVQNGRVILQGSVRSDLDARVIVDDLRDVTGVTRITDNLEINPDLD